MRKEGGWLILAFARVERFDLEESFVNDLRIIGWVNLNLDLEGNLDW